MRVLWMPLSPGWTRPRRGYPESAGYDVWSVESGTIEPGQSANIRLGFAAAFTPGYVAVVDDRGSTGDRRLTHLAGVIDPDYRGEWVVIMHNLGTEPYEYGPGRAIAQVLFLRAESPEEEVVDRLPPSARGSGKLGSSGH